MQHRIVKVWHRASELRVVQHQVARKGEQSLLMADGPNDSQTMHHNHNRCKAKNPYCYMTIKPTTGWNLTNEKWCSDLNKTLSEKSIINSLYHTQISSYKCARSCTLLLQHLKMIVSYLNKMHGINRKSHLTNIISIILVIFQSRIAISL